MRSAPGPSRSAAAAWQGAYLIIAARVLGLDTGPMSGFDNGGVDQEFFPEGQIKSNFLGALGYGDASVLFPRLPRRSFDAIAQIIECCVPNVCFRAKVASVWKRRNTSKDLARVPG